MKWEILKKAWKLARSKFPDAQGLYIRPPRSFALKGVCQVLDLEKSGEVLGDIDYEVAAVGGRPVIRMDLLEESAQVPLASVRQALKVTQKRTAVPKLPAIDYVLLKGKYRDPFDLGLKLAMLASTEMGANPSETDIESWMDRNLVPTNMRFPIEEALESMGIKLSTETRFNIREIKAKKRFEKRQRVRVVHPTSMEAQEAGTVMEIKGKPKTGYWYLVLVDGSSNPLWFPESALKAEEAGMIVNPIPEPIADE